MIRSKSRQYCLSHLLVEILDVDQKNESKDWPVFSKRLRRLLGDALRLYERREVLSAEEFQSKNWRLDGRLETLISTMARRIQM